MKSSLVLLPGLGANERLFAPQLEAFGDRGVIVPAWPERIDPSKGVEGVAALLRGSLAEQGSLHQDTVLVGFSFGAQMALSIARQRLDSG